MHKYDSCPKCGARKQAYSSTCKSCVRKGKPGTRLGMKSSPEHRAKISAALKGRIVSEAKRTRHSIAMSGDRHPRWKGGRRITPEGYVLIYSKDHPFSGADRCVFEHRLVMEAHLGRVLLPTEIVHHINGIPDDNRIENLMLFSTNGEHRAWHKKSRKEKRLCAQ